MNYAGLEGLLKQDPGNLSLLAHAAEAALREGKLDQCEDCLAAYAAEAPDRSSNPGLFNMKGMLALERREYADAAKHFTRALASKDDPVVRFNLAWSKAMAGAFEEAAQVLDDETALAAPRGPALKVRALHHLGKLEEAMETGLRLRASRPEDQALAGALAVVALDADRIDLAAQLASEGGDAPEALSTLGVLALDHGDREAAALLFDHVLTRNPDDPRALTGKGLCLLVTDPDNGAPYLDRSAEIFGRHSGSWIAAGWGHVVRKDFAAARARFEKAIELDPSFSEGHGGLAVLDAMANDLAGARKHAGVALRLDRQSFGGALANVLLLSAAGDEKGAARVRDLALSTPIGPDGKTIAQAMAQFGLRGPGSQP